MKGSCCCTYMYIYMYYIVHPESLIELCVLTPRLHASRLDYSSTITYHITLADSAQHTCIACMCAYALCLCVNCTRLVASAWDMPTTHCTSKHAQQSAHYACGAATMPSKTHAYYSTQCSACVLHLHACVRAHPTSAIMTLVTPSQNYMTHVTRAR